MDYLEKKKIIDDALFRFLSHHSRLPSILTTAIRYSVLNGGKRIRPILCLASAEVSGINPSLVLPTACALEFIHTQSLIKDDLPCMDNDFYRRGKLATWKRYNESTAILAGDGLIFLAYEVIIKHQLKILKKKSIKDAEDKIIKVLSEITHTSGIEGLITGQIIDLASKNKKPSLSKLKYIHKHKTAALFKASVRTGAILGGVNGERLKALSLYGENLGIAFQIRDDIQDFYQTNKVPLAEKGKATYPNILGKDMSKKEMEKYKERAIKSLIIFGKKGKILKDVAEFIIKM